MNKLQSTDRTDLVDELIEAYCRCCDCVVANTDVTLAKKRFEEVKAAIIESWPRPIPVTERPPDEDKNRQLAFRTKFKPNEYLAGNFSGGVFNANGDWEQGDNVFTPTAVIDWLPLPLSSESRA